MRLEAKLFPHYFLILPTTEATDFPVYLGLSTHTQTKLLYLLKAEVPKTANLRETPVRVCADLYNKTTVAVRGIGYKTNSSFMQ